MEVKFAELKKGDVIEVMFKEDNTTSRGVVTFDVDPEGYVYLVASDPESDGLTEWYGRSEEILHIDRVGNIFEL